MQHTGILASDIKSILYMYKDPTWIYVYVNREVNIRSAMRGTVVQLWLATSMRIMKRNPMSLGNEYKRKNL